MWCEGWGHHFSDWSLLGRMHSNWLKLRWLSVQLSNWIWPAWALWKWGSTPSFNPFWPESNVKVPATSRFISIKIKALKIFRLRGKRNNNNDKDNNYMSYPVSCVPWRLEKVSAIFVLGATIINLDSLLMLLLLLRLLLLTVSAGSVSPATTTATTSTPTQTTTTTTLHCALWRSKLSTLALNLLALLNEVYTWLIYAKRVSFQLM